MGRSDIPKSKWPILGAGLLAARKLHDVNGRKLRQEDVALGVGIPPSTYGAYEIGERLAPEILVDRVIQFYGYFPKSQAEILAARKLVYGKRVTPNMLLKLFAKEDPTKYDKQILRLRQDILSLCYRGKILEADQMSRPLWSHVQDIAKHEMTCRSLQPRSGALFAIACSRVASTLLDLSHEREIIKFACEKWNGGISPALKMRLSYAGFVNDLDRKRILGLEASISNSQMLKIVTAARLTAPDSGTALWDWIEFELEWNRLVSLTQPFGRKEAQHLEVIESDYSTWEERWPKYGRTIKNARLRVEAVSRDPSSVLAEIQAVDLEQLGREEQIALMHSKVIALSRQKCEPEAIEMGRIWMQKANDWGYRYQAERLFDRLEAIQDGHL